MPALDKRDPPCKTDSGWELNLHSRDQKISYFIFFELTFLMLAESFDGGTTQWGRCRHPGDSRILVIAEGFDSRNSTRFNHGAKRGEKSRMAWPNVGRFSVLPLSAGARGGQNAT
jgi:hypothetical protein